jgi:hypothetical protein
MPGRRGRRSRTAIVASSVLAGCGPSGAPKPPEDPVREARDPAVVPATAIAAYVVHHDRFVRRTLYSWTTTDQIAELRRTRQLLARDESPDSGGAYVDQVVWALAQSGHPIAKLLHTTTFARKRFAWPSAWATRMGWPGEGYGSELIRITLRSEALLLELSTATGAFGARDMHGAPVALDEVVAHPERIAAIYFVSDAASPAGAGVPAATATFREYVVCNEAMVESWAVGNDEIAGELEREADALDALARHVRRYGGDPVPVADAWPVTDDRDQRPAHAYAAGLALDSPSYPLDADGIALIASTLRAEIGATPAIAGGGTTPFPGLGASRGAPRIVTVIDGGTSWARPPSPTAAHLPPTPAP